MDQGRGPAAVEIERVGRAERDQQPGELGEIEAGVDAGAAPVTADGEQLVPVDAERAARMPLGRDVGVELTGPRREPLAILVADDDTIAGDEQRAGLDQVSGRGGRDLAPRRQRDSAAGLDVDAAALGPNGATIGSCATVCPPIRTSPSGRHGSRTKKPATIASGRPLAAHQ